MTRYERLIQYIAGAQQQQGNVAGGGGGLFGQRNNRTKRVDLQCVTFF